MGVSLPSRERGENAILGTGGAVKVVVFGATGMVGQGVLIECLDDPEIESVLAVAQVENHPRFQSRHNTEW